MENKKENIIGTMPIPRLVVMFGIPSMISMFVNSIYNLVDQIFIGQKVGYLGNAATNVTFPFVTISLALSLMISIGTAANVGLNLGRKDQEKADRTLATGFLMALLSGILVLAVGEILLVPMLKAFGATDKVLPYAIDYARIYILGCPLTAVGIMTSDEIRADGNPRFAMITMLSGAVFNIVFDWLFVFVLGWGVAGAAVATVMGQFVTMVMNLWYFATRLKTLNLKREYLHLNPHIAGGILALGFSSFLTQVTMLAQQIILNKLAVYYGGLSQYGPEIPLTVFGIVMKVNALMVSLVMGIVVGSQPVFSYNYGAMKYIRVKQLVKTCITIGLVIGIIGTICFQLFPGQIISIFGSEDALYNEFAQFALKTMTMLIFILGVQMTAGTYFQSVGKPMRALVISMCRSLIFMIPSLVILPMFMGVKGIAYAYPLSDIFALILCSSLLLIEIRRLNYEIQNNPEVS